MTMIEQLAGVHLGKAGDGTAVAPYKTPDTIDASLLVGVPRALNRGQYDIADGNPPFVGIDVWNCYEVSALTKNGKPVNYVVKIMYDASSFNIVESKSLKLYLNSYNMHKFDTHNEIMIREQISRQITFDLEPVLGVTPRVYVQEVSFLSQRAEQSQLPKGFYIVEECDSTDGLNFTEYNEAPDLLQTKDGGFVQLLHSVSLRSNCRVTNQPDWGDLYVYIEGPQHVTEASFLQYVVSMRGENHFHEEIVECVFKRLFDLLPKGTDIAVCAMYTRRGGIDINPIRATSYGRLSVFGDIAATFTASPKTPRQ